MSEAMLAPKKRLVMATKEMVEAQKSCASAFTPRAETDTTQAAKVWHEDDNFGGQATKALVMVLKTRGCDWLIKSGCTMCGYFNDSFFDDVSADHIILQFENAMREHQGEDLIKIYTSGSFFDEREVPAAAYTQILKRVGETTGRLSVESQPQIMTDAQVAEAMTHLKEFEVGIGMESAHDDVLAHSVNKAFRFRQFVAGAELIHRHGARAKTYLVQKAPFLTEREAIEDTTTSILKVAPHSDVVSVNPINVQRHTLVADLYKHGAFRPPWLWSVAKVVLDASRELPDGVTLKCHPVGGGHARGAHNCGKCDKRAMKALEDYTLGRGTIRLERLFETPECGCYSRWQWELDNEGLLGAACWTDPVVW
ncbi:MAG: archaeosine biosynthesis radical SAM protein RaSEA [Euryarchaeota archaeon]|nr:archaeosine biosynthesis radical SAM protein RaSEA [Euryarchaeota archaeon]